MLAAVSLLVSAGLILSFDLPGPPRIEPGADNPIRAVFHQRIAFTQMPARELAFSPDGSLLAASGADGGIRIWRLARPGPPRLLNHDGGATSIAFSADGALLASGGYDGKIILWRVADGRPMRTLVGHQGTVWTVDMSDDGERVASGGEDGHVRLWRTHDGTPIADRKGHDLNVWKVRFGPGGALLASASFDQRIGLWDGRTAAPQKFLPGHTQAVVALDIGASGRLLASGGDDSTIRLWSLPGGAPLRTMDAHEHAYSVAISPDGQWLASAGRARSAAATFWHETTGLGRPGPSVRLWRIRDGRELQSLDLADDPWSVAFSPDGKWLAAASGEGILTIWRIERRAGAPAR
jgi:WD40 repeat protein